MLNLRFHYVPAAALPKLAEGEFCRVVFVFSLHDDGLTTWGNPRPEKPGALVNTIPATGGLHDTRYMPLNYVR